MQVKKTLRLCLLMVLSSPALLAQVSGLAGWDIYLDPGHSRKENMGIYGYSEAEKNLRVGLQLRDLLLTKTDIDTVYNSRFNDVELVSLSQRTDEANSLGAAWYHSIHSDAGSPNLNSTLLLWGQYRDGREKIPEGGQAMSDIMVKILTRAMRINTRGSIGDCSFYGCTFSGPYLHVNRESSMPSELSEAGFHTSTVQNPRNMNAQWKRLEAYAFFWSILKFHQLPRPPVGIVTGFIYDVEKDRPLNGARVRIDGQEYLTDTYESLFHQYTSDPELLQNGFYFIEDLPNDTLEMIVEADGFHSDTLSVAVIDTFFTFVDVNLISTLPPNVTATLPEQNAPAVPVLDKIVVQFSRRMDRVSTEAALSFTPAVDYQVTWRNSNRTLEIQPVSLEFATEYTLTISAAATDLYNHPLDGNSDGSGGDDFLLTFTTEVEDVFPPQIEAVYPPLNATGVENHPIINFEFDELLDDASVTQNSIVLEKNGGAETVPGTVVHYVLDDISVLCFFPVEPLDVESQYLSKVASGLKDIFGNTIENEQVFNFNTGNFIYTDNKLDDFESGLLSNWWQPQQSGTTTGIITGETSMGNNSRFTNLLSGSSRSMRLSYGWDVNANSWLIREYLAGGSPRNVLFDDSYILQMYVFGDGSGNRIRFAIDDNVPNNNAANHEVSLWFTIDWRGWRLISWDLTNDPVGDWIGNGVVEGTLRFDSIQLTYTAGGAQSGSIYIDDLRLVKRTIVDISEEPRVSIPASYALFQNYPNPFNPETTIRYTVAQKAQPVRLFIYDVLGRLVRRLVDDIRPAGTHSVRWDGKNDRGAPVGSGAYLYELIVGEFRQTRKMMLIR